MRLLLIPALAAAATSASAASAQESPGGAKVVQEIDACRSITDPAERLACFDRSAAALVTATQNREVVVLDEQEVKRTERSLFGFSLPKLNLFGSRGEDDRRDAARPSIDEIASTITGVAQAGYGKWAFALEDGSNWVTIEMNASLRPRVGDPIVIKRAALGSFRASVKGASLVRIRRTG